MESSNARFENNDLNFDQLLDHVNDRQNNLSKQLKKNWRQSVHR